MVMQAYPIPGKRKSLDLCQAFIDGAKKMGAREHSSVFYGIGSMNVGTWRSVNTKLRLGGDPFYFIDNSYFDASRETHFRVTRNAVQYHGKEASSGERLRAIFGGNPDIKPWRSTDDPGYVLIVPQSDAHMNLTIGYSGDWISETVHLCARTWPDREIKIRPWSSNKPELAKTLPQDLEGAACLVTHTSAAAITAVVAGVSVVTDSQHALAGWMFSSDPTQDQRLHALRVLADNQWTLDEIKQGKAWAWLNRTSIGTT